MKIGLTTFKPVDDSEGWYATCDAAPDCQPLIELALQLHSEALARGYYCVCGMKEYEGYYLYLAPAIGVRSILEVFGVGSHGGDDVNSVYEQIAAADAQNPLIPYFADGAGLKARFSKPITPQLLEVLEKTVINGEIMMSDDDGSIGDFVATNKEVQLWWD